MVVYAHLEAFNGALAARVILAAPVSEPGLDQADQRARLRLNVQARQLVDQVQALKRRKPLMEEALYRQRLEAVLLELALNRRAWRARAAK